MFKSMLIAASLLTLASQADATTYDYVGQPFTSFSGQCNSNSCTHITGSVTFNFDTSNFSGELSLSDVSTATLIGGGVINLSDSAIKPQSISFPSSTSWFNPPYNTYGLFGGIISGTFDLLDGSITSWALYGQTNQVGCGGGPGCALGTSTISTSSTMGDSSFADSYYGVSPSASGPSGFWIEEQVAAVPEPSTWAMLLIGFAGIGVMTYRRHQFTKPAGGVPT
jgi:hypothetical protein